MKPDLRVRVEVTVLPVTLEQRVAFQVVLVALVEPGVLVAFPVEMAATVEPEDPVGFPLEMAETVGMEVQGGVVVFPLGTVETAVRVEMVVQAETAAMVALGEKVE